MNTKSPVESLLALVASVFDAYTVVLFEQEPDGQHAQLVAYFSMGDAVNPAARIAPGRGLAGWILRNKAPLLVNSIDENQAWLGYYYDKDAPDIHSFMGCPIPGGGALCIDSTRSQAFADSRQKLLHLFALMIPQMENLAGSSGQEEEVVTYFAALARISELRIENPGWSAYLSQLLPLLAAVTSFDYIAFATKPDGSTSYIVESEHPPLLNQQGEQTELPVGNGIVGWVFRNEEGVHNEGTNVAASTPIFGKSPQVPEFACSICLPVVVDRCTCGVLCLAGMAPRKFSPELRDFARLVADDTARLLETITLRYKVHSLMPKASVQRSGGVVYDPDTVSIPRQTEE